MMAIMMVFTMMPMAGSAAYAENDPLPKSGFVTLDGDANELQDQTITLNRLVNGLTDPSKILKTNFTNSDDYTWSIAKAESSATTVTLSKNGTESTEFHDLTKNDAIKITCNGEGSETLLFSVTGPDFGREFNIYVLGNTIPPSLGDDENINLGVGKTATIGDLSQIFDDDGNSYILHEYNYQVGDYDENIVSVVNKTHDGVDAKDDDYVTALEVTGKNVGTTVVEVTLCNNDRVPIEIVDAIPPHITKKFTINVVDVIDRVEMTIDPPKCGTTVVTTENEGKIKQSDSPKVTLQGNTYEIASEYKDSGSDGIWFSRKDNAAFSGTFQAGENYEALIKLNPKQGYGFQEDLTVYVNGSPLNGEDVVSDNTTATIYPVLTAEHDWKAATCTAPETCKGCGTTKGKPLDHKWDAGKVTKKATEKATGTKTYTCTVCKATKTETIPKLKPSTPKTSGTPTAKMTAKGKASLVISWNIIQNVAGYDIFFAQCNHSGKTITCKKVKTIKGNKTFKWTKSGLKKGTAYKAYVKAYVMKNGKKSYVRTSPMMHAYTGGQTKNYTNAKSVTVKKASVTLKKGKTFKIKATVNKVNKKKKLMSKSHAPTLRYMTSNSKVATVNSSGKITAKGKGTCYIYAYAHNGVSKQVKVTVK